MSKTLTKKIDAEVQKLLKTYLELDTSFVDGRNYPTVISLFSKLFKKLGFKLEIVTIPEKVALAKNRQNIIARLYKDTNLPTLMVYNHIDVVPADYQGAFTLRLEKGRYYARGVADHKGSTIALIQAIKNLDINKLRFNLIFILTTDEETNQADQLEYLEKFLKLPSDCFCFDPDTFAGGVTTAHLGVWQADLRIQGKSAHSAASHLGVNAIEKGLLLSELFLELKKQAESQQSSLVSFPNQGTSLSITSRFNVNKVIGGGARNVVPDSCLISIDARFIPEIAVLAEAKKIKERITKRAKELQIEFGYENELVIEGYVSKHSEIDTLEQVLTAQTEESGQYCVMGSTPAAAWLRKLGIPHFGIGVARYDSNVHGINENCLRSDIENLAVVFKEYIEKA